MRTRLGHVAAESGQSQTVVRLENVSKTFGTNKVLDGVTVSVERSEKLVVIGPSGSGKSTLLRCIIGLEPVQEGTIEIDGRLLSGRRIGDQLVPDVRSVRQIRASVGMVFQSYALFPHLTALQNITLALIHVRRMTRTEAVRKALALLDGSASTERRTNTPVSFRAANSSGSPSLARSRLSRRSCCLTK